MHPALPLGKKQGCGNANEFRMSVVTLVGVYVSSHGSERAIRGSLVAVMATLRAAVCGVQVWQFAAEFQRREAVRRRGFMMAARSSHETDKMIGDMIWYSLSKPFVPSLRRTRAGVDRHSSKSHPGKLSSLHQRDRYIKCFDTDVLFQCRTEPHVYSFSDEDHLSSSFIMRALGVSVLF